MFSLNDAKNRNDVPQRQQNFGNYFNCSAPSTTNQSIATQYRTADDWRALSKEWSKSVQTVYSGGRNSSVDNNESNEYEIAPPAPLWQSKSQPMNLSAGSTTTLSNIFGTARNQSSNFSIASTNQYQQHITEQPICGNIRYGQLSQSTFLAPNKGIAFQYFNEQNNVMETPKYQNSSLANASEHKVDFKKSYVLQPSVITTASSSRGSAVTLPLKQKRASDLTQGMPAKLRRCNEVQWNATSKPFVQTKTVETKIENTAKHVKTIKTETFKYAIIDINYKGGEIAKAHQATLEKAWTNGLIELIMASSNKFTPEIHIKQTEFVENIFWITFEASNTDTVGALRKMVMRLPSLWNNCSLRFVASPKVPKASRVSVVIGKQGNNLSNSQILTILAQQNRQLCMESWKLRRLAKSRQNESIEFLIVMNKESFYTLKAMDGRLYFLATTITCNFEPSSPKTSSSKVEGSRPTSKRSSSEIEKISQAQQISPKSNVTIEETAMQIKTEQNHKNHEMKQANENHEENLAQPIIINLDEDDEINSSTKNSNEMKLQHKSENVQKDEQLNEKQNSELENSE